MEVKMLNSEESLLMVIDVQGKLAHVVENDEYYLVQVKKLISGVVALSLPVILTAQAPEKLGHTLPEVAELLPQTEEIPRTSFSAFREVRILSALNQHGRRKILLCGYEAHVCVCQCALDLINAGYEVYFVVDAISARAGINAEVAAKRVAAAGGNLVTVEMVLFEILRDAAHPAFKTISKIIK
jgi:nicotinamidase-related amidase